MNNQSYTSGTPEYEEYVNQGYERHKGNQASHLANIKARFKYLNIQWTPVIEQEAMRRDGGGITVYLRDISELQEQAKKELQALTPNWGTWG